MKPNIIHEDPQYFIVEKPPGLLVHDAPSRAGEKTLVQELLRRDPAISGVGDPARPGLVHRLDREVSGIMVIPRTPEMYYHLLAQFKSRKIRKVYIALIYGKISRDEGVIDFPIGRSTKGGRMAARPATGERGDAKDSSTEFTVLKRWPHKTLLEVIPKTGRTHQIRAHLAARGHPIVGDDLYRTRNVKTKKIAPRLMLHAWKLGFEDLDGTWQEFISEPPKEFQI